MIQNTEPRSAPEAESTPETATPSTSAADDVGPGSTSPMMGGGESKEKEEAEKKKKTSIDKRYAKAASVQIRDPPVTETRGYEVVQVKDKHGQLYLAIPEMPLALAVLCCLLNIVLPGTGTLISAFSVFCCGLTKIDKTWRAFGLNIASALLQMVTFLLIVGWIWSIRWGMTFVQLSLSTNKGKNIEQLPYYVRRQSSVDYEKQQSKHAQH